jgi:hypothetical protein
MGRGDVGVDEVGGGAVGVACSYPKNASATSYQSGGTVFSSGDAAVDGDPAGVAAHHLDDHDAVVRLGRRVQPVDRLMQIETAVSKPTV